MTHSQTTSALTKFALLAIFSIANTTYPTRAGEVFRCQNTYTDLPCSPAASTAETPLANDARTPAQTRQAQGAAKQQQMSAQALLASRTRQEAQDQRAQMLQAQNLATASQRPAPEVKSPPHQAVGVSNTLRSASNKQATTKTPFFIAKGPDPAEGEKSPRKEKK